MVAGTALGVERSLEFEVFASGHALAPSVQSSCLLALPSKVGLSRPSQYDRRSKSRVAHVLKFESFIKLLAKATNPKSLNVGIYEGPDQPQIVGLVVWSIKFLFVL